MFEENSGFERGNTNLDTLQQNPKPWSGNNEPEPELQQQKCSTNKKVPYNRQQ